MKIRTFSHLVEFLGACFIYLLIVPPYFYTRIPHPAVPDPPVTYPSLIPENLFIFLGTTPDPVWVIGPECKRTHDIFDGIGDLIALMIPNITFTLKYASNDRELRDKVYGSDMNSLGIYWSNANESDAVYSPDIHLFRQTFFGSPDLDVFDLLRRIIAIENGHWTDLLTSNISQQEFPTLKHTEYLGMHPLVAFFSTLPCLLGTMPDFQTVLDEKDAKVASLAFLMGCSEAAYWFVSIVVPIVMTLFPYLLMSLAYSYVFLMPGTDFVMLYVLSALFIISHVIFQLFLSTFMKTAAQGRSTVIVILVFAIFFCFVHLIYTLDPKNSKVSMKHIFSILPVSAYELAIMSMYNCSIMGYGGRTWRDFWGNDGASSYPICYGYFWLGGTAIVYLLLFLLLNLLNPREFGIPLITWRDICSLRGWRRAFTHQHEVTDAFEGRSGEFIEVENLHKTYVGIKTFHALRGVSFHINAGEVIVIIGPNGAGKSTLLNILAGAIEPSEGTIRIMGGEPLRRFAELQRLIGVCFQDNVFVGPLSIRENLEFFGAFRGVHPAVLEDTIQFFADTLQLREMLDNPAENLSGGQKRKLCIGISLLGNPPMVIFDEPTAGVDVQARQLIWKTISALKETTCIVTSHALEEAEAVSSRLFIVADGQLKFSGTSTQLRNQFRCGYLLRLETDAGPVGPVLELAQSFVREAKISDERSDTIAMPVHDSVPEFLRAMVERQDELGIRSYSFAVEQIEDMLLRLIMAEEVTNKQNYD